MTDLKQQVAKDLADSGLFKRKIACSSCFVVGGESDLGEECMECLNGEYVYLDIFLGADQAEAVLGEMELQVVWDERTPDITGWALADNMLDVVYDEEQLPCIWDVFQGADRKESTLAKNYWLAWLLAESFWKPKLKSALERLGWV